MDAQRLLRTDAGALRAPWRLLLFLVASAVATFGIGAILGPIISFVFDASGLSGISNQYIVAALGAWAGTAFMLSYVDKREWSDVWLDAGALRARLLTIGFALGSVAIGIPILLLLAAHWLKQEPGGVGSPFTAIARLTVFLLPAALTEELISRGYILTVLRGAWGWPAAIAATSIGFGLLHLNNPGVTVQSTVLVILAGVFLASVVWATRSLYAAWMAHFAWNWTMAVVFHTAVSGIPLESPGYRYVDAGPDWATGGEWGPEGGLPAGAGMVAGTGVMYMIARRRRESRPVNP